MQIEVFETRGKQWCWHFRNKGRVTADSEQFPTKAHAIRAGKAVVRAVVPKNIGVTFDDPVIRNGVIVIKWY